MRACLGYVGSAMNRSARVVGCALQHARAYPRLTQHFLSTAARPPSRRFHAPPIIDCWVPPTQP